MPWFSCRSLLLSCLVVEVCFSIVSGEVWKRRGSGKEKRKKRGEEEEKGERMRKGQVAWPRFVPNRATSFGLGALSALDLCPKPLPSCFLGLDERRGCRAPREAAWVAVRDAAKVTCGLRSSSNKLTSTDTSGGSGGNLFPFDHLLCGRCQRISVSNAPREGNWPHRQHCLPVCTFHSTV